MRVAIDIRRAGDFGIGTYIRNIVNQFARAADDTNQHHFLPDGVTLDQYEQEIIREALRRAEGNKSQAARLLGLTRNALRYRLTQMGMEA